LGLGALGVAIGTGGRAFAQAPEEGEKVEASKVDTSTFEGLARTATPSADLSILLAPYFDKCTDKRDIDRMRCESARQHLKKTLPQRSYIIQVRDPAAVGVSDYDAKVKGYKLTFAGCVACSQPVTIGASGEKRMVTLAPPRRDAENITEAVAIKRPNLQFDGVPEAKTWLKNVRPHLRAEFVFQPQGEEWSFGPSRGFAFKLLGGRVYDACNGDVLASTPPSTGQADRFADEPGCPRAGDEAVSDGPKEDENLPTRLTKSDIDKVMGRIKGQVYACYQQFEVPGRAELHFEVAGNGMVQGIKLKGGLEGTPTGECVLEAAKNARFPKFKKDRQAFVYPFMLR